MLSFPDKSFDITLTSPPFKEEDVPGDYWTFYEQCFNEICRVTSKVVIILHSSTKLNHIVSCWPPKRTLVWGKVGTMYTYRYNPIFVYQMSDDYKVNKYIWNDCFVHMPRNGNKKLHRYEDPVNLYLELLKMFKSCQTVLDPFIGSGTTAKAATQLEMDCTGIDVIDYRETI